MLTNAIAQRPRKRLAAAVFACVLCFGLATAQAAPGTVAGLDTAIQWSDPTGHELEAFQRCMSLNEAVSRAKRQGKVISAETRGSRHVIKVLTSDNRVKTLTFPACG